MWICSFCCTRTGGRLIFSKYHRPHEKAWHQSVTEGVETKQQRDFVRQIGCGMLQGYYYSKPIPGDIFFEEIERRGLKLESAEDRRFYEKLQAFWR